MLNHEERTQPHTLPPVGTIGHLVVVPRTTGPLLELGSSREPIVDDLDEAIDELFGETTEEHPGMLDAVLVAGGGAIAGWALVSGAPVSALALGVALVVLGVALPARAAVRLSRERRMAATRRRVLGKGIALDMADPSVDAMVGAYEACLKIATRTDTPLGRDAADAAHLALVEVASLLSGQPPVAAAEIEYVRKRTEAIGRLTRSLQGTQRARFVTRPVAVIHGAADQQWATAVAQAREELDSSTGLGSLDRMADLASAANEEVHDAAH